MARPERFRLGDLLIQEALITASQLDEALVDQKKSGRRLGRIFVDRQWVTEVQIAKTVAKQIRAPYVDLSQRVIRPEAATLLPEVHARRLRDGQIVAIGGLMKQEQHDERSGLPVLSEDRKSTRLNSSHLRLSRMPSSA